MSPGRRKILRIVLASLAGLFLVVVVAGIFVVRSVWFSNYVRQRIIQAVEESTGGRVEIARFTFDWSHLRAQVHGFVLHGTEPVDAKPLFRAEDLTVELRLLSIFKAKKVDIASLTVEQPQANLIVFPDGRTNVPSPKVQHSSDKTALQTIVDLQVGHFALNNGDVQYGDQKIPLSAHGENLKADLYYETLRSRYRGTLLMSPLSLQSGKNPRLDVNVSLPVALEEDKVELSNAVLATANSRLQIDGSVQHLVSPTASGHIAGQLGLDELNRALGLNIPLATGKNVPRDLQLEVAVNTQGDGMKISVLKLGLGQSAVEASGDLKNVALEQGTLQFNSHLAIAELSRVFKLAAGADGMLQLNGNATLNGTSQYAVDANLTGQNLAFRQGDIRITNASLNSHLKVDPKVIQANPIRASLAGGHFDGRATLENFAKYQVNGNLSRFDLQQVVALALSKKPAWSGTISGPVEAQGDLNSAAAGSLAVHTRLAIAPNGRGIPVSGQLNVDYDGRTDNISLGQSFIALPSSRLDFSGSLGQQVAVNLRSRNLDDFLPALALTSDKPPTALPVRLDPGGSAVVDAVITGKVSSPVISGHATVDRFQVQQRQFDSLAADFHAQSSGASIQNAKLTHGPLDAELQATVGLDQWKLEDHDALTASLSIKNADVKDVLAFAGEADLPVRGALTVNAQASGTVGDPRGATDLSIVNGEAYGEPLDRVNGQVVYGGQTITVPSLQVVSGMSRANITASFDHPQNSFSTGNIRAHVDTNQVGLSTLRTLRQRRPDLDGQVQINADVTAVLPPGTGSSTPELTSVNGNVAARGLKMQGKNLGDLTATAQTSGKQLAFRLNSDFAGSTIRADGQTDLSPNYPTKATISIANLPVEQVLAVAGRSDFMARGMFSADGQVAGTLHDPRANLDINLTRASIQGQNIDRAQGHVNYSNTLVDLPSLEVDAGPNRVTLAASFTHPADQFSTGDVRLRVESNTLQLAQLQVVQQYKPGLAGALQLALNGAGKLNPPTANAQEPRLVLSSLNGRVAANGVRVNGRDYGNFTATAEQTGSAVKFNVDSNLAQSTIHGTGEAQLTRDYPVNAQLSFSNVRYSNWTGLISSAKLNVTPGFDALVEGNVNVAGPAMRPQNLTGTAQLTKVELQTRPATNLSNSAPVLALQNEGPITLVATQTGIQVQRAHLTGPSTDISVTGGVTLRPATAFNLQVNATGDLSLLQKIDPDISSEGNLAMNGSITGPLGEPVINGRLELKNAAFQMSDWPNGISSANGAIIFTGNTARIQTLTAESGGGRITITGYATRAGSDVTFNLETRAQGVRVRTPQGASIQANANVKLNGSTQSSLVSGTVTILGVGFNTRTDIGSILSGAAQPVQTPGSSEGLFSTIRLDIKIRTAPGTTFQTAFAENLEAQADLTLRGTLANPGMLGRVNITQGRLSFFGTKYTVNEGSIQFYNPNKIEPVLNLNLETTARGVDVILTVTGPVDNMNLSYQSDPPLQFSEIVALLAAGKTPTSDPVLVANQPPTPQQTYQQMGESALVGAALANPVAGQLQRVFGVTQLKIDPTFTSGSELPQARLTLQQQVATNLTFTYVTDLTKSDPQIIRVEWAIGPQWSAVASREPNGMVGVDLFYKRRFR